MAEQGYVLDIDTQFLQRLEKADEALGKFIKSTDKLTQKFDDLASGGLSRFANAIDSIVQSISQVSKVDVGDMGISKVSEVASRAADDVVELSKAVGNINSVDVGNVHVSDFILIDTKALEKEVDALEKAINKTERKRDEHRTKLRKLEKAEAAPSAIRDAKASYDTDRANLSRLKRQLKEVQELLRDAEIKNKEALSNMLSSRVDEFIPIANLKANIKEIDKMIHEVPSMYPDPAEQQRVVDQLVALRDKYKQAIKSSGQKNDEYQKELEAKKKIVEAAERADEAEARSNKKKAQSVIDNYNKEMEAARKSIESRQKMYEDLWDKMEHDERTTFSGAMDYSKSTRSINEQIQAIKYLKEARGKLDKSTLGEAEYRRQVNAINEEIQRQQKEVDRLTGKYRELSAQQKALTAAATKLTNVMGTMFSVQAIRGYINQIVRVRGEFELQQKSLRAIVQDVDAADKIWSQTLQFAMKSPFQAKELVTYTKQLAAYRIETEKLHDTTKMLADISAGLGVEMNRLILAYGQVKAANYLRGTELRQFSEAGLNVLGELSKYFSEVEGRAISVGDVFEMVSKRLVSFADVEEVLRRVTSEGGIFYEMQEKQARTVKGMVSNLKDAMDIMLNEIGKETESSIKGVLEAMRRLVANWKEILYTVKGVGAAFIAFKGITSIYTLGMKNAASANLWFNSSLKAQIGSSLKNIQILKWSETATLGLTKAQYLLGKATMFLQGTLRGLSTILMAVLPIAALTAIVEVVRRLTEAGRAARELKASLSNIISEDVGNVDKSAQSYKDLVERLKLANEGSKERRDIIARLNNEYGEYLDFMVTEATTVDSLSNSYDSLVDRMKEKASLATYEKGVQEIFDSYGEKLQDAQKEFFDAFTYGDGLPVVKDAENILGMITGIIPKKEEVQQMLNLIRQAVNEANGEIESSAQLVNDIISGYYGEGYKLDAERMSSTTQYVDLMIEQKEKEKELQKEINNYYGKTLRSREANLALQKLENEYAQKQREIKNESNLSDFDVRQKLNELKDKFEEEKIQIYFEFGEISEEEKNRQINSLRNWATAATKSINDTIRQELGSAFSAEELSRVLITREMQQTKSLGEYLSEITESWKQQCEIIEEQISLKSEGIAIDEDMLKKAERLESIYRAVADILGIELEHTKRISEAMRESINDNLPEDFHVSLEQAYGGMDKLISSLQNSEKEILKSIEQINEQKKEGLNYDEKELKALEDKYFWTKRTLDLLDPATEDPMDKGKVDYINSKLKAEYQISATDAAKNEVTLLKEANDERDKAMAHEAQLLAMKEQGVPISQDELDYAKEQVEQYTLRAKLLGYIEKEKSTGGGRHNSLYDERIKVIDDLNKKYKELARTLSDAEAKQGAFDAYIDAFAKAYEGVNWVPSDVASMDVEEFVTKVLNFPSEDAIVAFFDKLADEPMKAFEKIKVELAKGEYVYDIKVQAKVKNDANLNQQIEDLFSGYELSLELDKLNIPKSFAQDFFNIEAVSLTELRNKIESMRPQFVGTSMEEEYDKYLKKIDEMERKAQEERLKTYLQYARDTVGERAKIKLEELRKLQEIEETFGKEHEPEKQAAIKKVQSDSYQATQKLEWEEFQKSDTFISLFEDLDSASSALTEHMIKKLEDFKDEWKDMPLEDMKSIVDKIGQLRTHLVEQDAFKWGKELSDKVKKDGRSESEIQEENIAEEERISEYDREIELLQTILRLKEEGKAVQALAYAGSQDAADMSALNVKELKKEIEEREKARKKSKETVDNNKQALKDQQDLRKAYAAQAQYIQEGQKMANDLYDAFSDIMDVLGQGDGMGAMFAQMGMDMANSVMNCFALQLQLKATTVEAHTFGAAMKTAMGIVGWIVMGVQLIGTALKAAFDAHDMRIDKQIQQLAKNVEYLQGRFEEFEKALDKAFSTTQVESFTKALSDNIDRQIANYERMRRLEEDKKRTDQSKIDEYNDAIKDLSEQRKEIFEEQQSNVTAGILDDALSAAEGFVDAWYEAFKETGDGLSGLRENFKEMLTSLIKKQAAMQIVGHYTKMYSDWLAGYIDVAGGDAMLTADEAKKWAAEVKETMPELNAMLENFFSGTQELLQEEGSLSELSKGIQGVTESTAQVLEALLNSMRFYVADSNTQLKAIAASFASNDVERNPLLNELRQQTALIRSIESMFDSVIGRGSGPHSGSYIKVLM